jgi:hypothetical protein
MLTKRAHVSIYLVQSTVTVVGLRGVLQPTPGNGTRPVREYKLRVKLVFSLSRLGMSKHANWR